MGGLKLVAYGIFPKPGIQQHILGEHGMKLGDPVPGRRRFSVSSIAKGLQR